MVYITALYACYESLQLLTDKRRTVSGSQTKRLPPNSFQSNDERMTEEITVRKLLHIEVYCDGVYSMARNCIRHKSARYLVEEQIYSMTVYSCDLAPNKGDLTQSKRNRNREQDLSI